MVSTMTLFETQETFCIRNFESCASIINKIYDRFEDSTAIVDRIRAAYLQVTQPVLALGLLALGFLLFLL